MLLVWGGAVLARLARGSVPKITWQRHHVFLLLRVVGSVIVRSRLGLALEILTGDVRFAPECTCRVRQHSNEQAVKEGRLCFCSGSWLVALLSSGRKTFIPCVRVVVGAWQAFFQRGADARESAGDYGARHRASD